MSEDKRPARPPIDVRTLSLSQLKKYADKGSRRARAELEARMQTLAGGTPAAPFQPSAPAPANSGFAGVTDFSALATQPGSLAARATRPGRLQAASTAAASPAPAARAVVPPISSIPPPASPASPAPRVPPASPVPPPADADAEAPSHADALAEKLHLLARQEDAFKRASDAPKLVGAALIGWGGLLLLGGLWVLISSQHKGAGGYYFLGGALCALAGWLLWHGRRAALLVHGVAAVLMFGLSFMWLRDGVLSVLMLSAPFWASACWMAAPPVRDPLN